jgi:hypothetical protein
VKKRQPNSCDIDHKVSIKESQGIRKKTIRVYEKDTRKSMAHHHAEEVRSAEDFVQSAVSYNGTWLYRGARLDLGRGYSISDQVDSTWVWVLRGTRESACVSGCSAGGVRVGGRPEHGRGVRVRAWRGSGLCGGLRGEVGGV